jgi:ribosome biogenesis GTPase
VQAALAAGELSQERWTSYRKLLGEARRHEVLTDSNAAREQKRKWKQIHKAMRNFTKEQRSGSG